MKFLVAVDGSQQADDALAYATEVAAAMDGDITVVYAVDPRVYETGGSEPVRTLSEADRRLIVESIADAERRGLDVLDEAAALASDLGLTVETELLYGDPDVRIAAYAETMGFDAIFVGHRGRSERTERMLGSVAKAVVQRASVPVTVVR